MDTITGAVKMVAVNFAEWKYKNGYISKYFGNEGDNCDKWYKQYTTPDRKYYTTDELYEMFLIDERERLKKDKESQVLQ